jgi:hypothetical protein
MATSKEFKDLQDVQEAIRLWCQAYPNQVAPDFLVKALLDAEEAHKKSRRGSFCDGFLQAEVGSG